MIQNTYKFIIDHGKWTYNIGLTPSVNYPYTGRVG